MSSTKKVLGYSAARSQRNLPGEAVAMADAMSVEELFSQLNGIITSEDPNNEEALGVVNQSLPRPPHSVLTSLREPS
jgi:hypothetical protein